MRIESRNAFSLIESSIVILIIAILIAGITQSSRLVSQMRLNTARTLTQSAPVASMRNLVLWYETTSDKSFDDADQQDGTLATNWYDINLTATSKINASSSGAARPTYKTDCINNLPCLNFDGGDYMDTVSLGVTSATMTYIAVINPTTISSSAYTSFVMTYGAYSAGNNSVHFQIRTGADQNKFQFAPVNGSQSAISTAALVANTPYILSAIDNASNIVLYKNGASAVSVSTTSADKTLGVLNIGSYNDGSTRSRYLTGYVGEIIIFDRALKAEERQSIESYLGKKWGIRI